jgi:hypothetical protein
VRRHLENIGKVVGRSNNHRDGAVVGAAQYKRRL